METYSSLDWLNPLEMAYGGKKKKADIISEQPMIEKKGGLSTQKNVVIDTYTYLANTNTLLYNIGIR